MSSTALSPLRAVLFWPNAPTTNPADDPLVKFGMAEYIYAPLGLEFPADDPQRYIKDARLTFEYVTMVRMVTLADYVSAIKNNHTLPSTGGGAPAHAHWKSVSRYYSSVIEPLAASKSSDISSHLLKATTFEDIVPREVVPIARLTYSTETIRFLHRISFNMLHDNPTDLFKALATFMASAATGKNMYTCIFFHSLAKACKTSTVMNMRIRCRPLKKDSGVCFGPLNMHVKKVADQYTVKVCPWCYKPVNVAVKKKSSAGGAHKSQIFTDEYTQEALYCTEKNQRGILSFPLMCVDDKDTVYANDLEWIINGGLTCVFSITQTQTKANLTITNKRTGEVLFTPLETGSHCTDVDPCMLCTTQ